MKSSFKKIIMFTSISSITPLVAISCASNVLLAKDYRGLVFSDSTNLSYRRKRIDLRDLHTYDLKKLPKSLNHAFASPMLVGGFGEPRSFYHKTTDKTFEGVQWHLGSDLIVTKDSPVMAPFAGQIVAAIYIPNDHVAEDAEGVGGVVVQKVLVKDLEWEQSRIDTLIPPGIEHLYMQYMHLSKEKTLNLYGHRTLIEDTSPKGNDRILERPTALDNFMVKKGQALGYVGNYSENGGWAPHVHVQVMLGNEKNDTRIAKWGQIDHSGKDISKSSYFRGIQIYGIFEDGIYRPKNEEESREQIGKELLANFLDPNLLLNLYSYDTEIVKIKWE